VEEIVIVADLVAALETVVDLAAARGEIVDDAADLTHEIVEEDAVRLEAALDRDHEDEMIDETGNEAVLEANLDLAREIVARNHAMRMKRNARDPARPRRNDLDPALDPDLAPVKDLSFSTSKY